MKILIDFDNTILNTSESVPKVWNYLHPTRQVKELPIEEVKWDFSNVLGDTDLTLGELLSMFDYKYFYNHAIMIDGAIEYIKELSKDNEVIIVSKHMESRKQLTLNYIHEILPNVEVMFVDSFEAKRELSADIIIDDKTESLRGKAEVSILFGDYAYTDREYSGIRCKDWDCVKCFIDYINSLKNN